jgi:hypothetical protein
MTDGMTPIGLVVPVLRGNLLRQLCQTVFGNHRPKGDDPTGQSDFDLVSFLETGLNQKGLGKSEPDAVSPTREPSLQSSLRCSARKAYIH